MLLLHLFLQHHSIMLLHQLLLHNNIMPRLSLSLPSNTMLLLSLVPQHNSSTLLRLLHLLHSNIMPLPQCLLQPNNIMPLTRPTSPRPTSSINSNISSRKLRASGPHLCRYLLISSNNKMRNSPLRLNHRNISRPLPRNSHHLLSRRLTANRLSILAVCRTWTTALLQLLTLSALARHRMTLEPLTEEATELATETQIPSSHSN